jgi:hypothetical protein
MEKLQRYADLRADGWSREVVRQGVERGTLHRAVRGVYTASGAPPDRERALLLKSPPGSVLGVQSAARRYGLPVPPDPRLHVVVPPGVAVPLIKGVAAHASVLPVPEPVWIDGVPCVPPERCAVDLARTLRRQDALPVLDAVLRNGLCSADDLIREVRRHDRLRGVRQARELVPLADPRAECVQETQLRLLLLDGRLPAPVPQLWIPDEYGVPLYRVDLGYDDHRVALEYEGASHDAPGAVTHDRARHNWLSDHGWRMRYFTARDLYRNPSAVVSSVRALLAPLAP